MSAIDQTLLADYLNSDPDWRRLGRSRVFFIQLRGSAQELGLGFLAQMYDDSLERIVSAQDNLFCEAVQRLASK